MWYFWQLTSRQELGLRVSCVAFCLALAAVYLFSTLSHAVQEPGLRHQLRAWDQGLIYLLIVGTYTPFVWQGTTGAFRIVLLSAIWLAALWGFYAKVFAAHRINAVSTITYLALGWLPAMPLISSTPRICFMWMLLGGLCYTGGVVFLLQSQRVRYSHAVWHIMVILGSACHAYAVYWLIQVTT